MKDLEKLGGNDTIRGQVYLQHGGLRAADKIYFTIAGRGVDLTTVETVLTQMERASLSLERHFTKAKAPVICGRRTVRASPSPAGSSTNHRCSSVRSSRTRGLRPSRPSTRPGIARSSPTI